MTIESKFQAMFPTAEDVEVMDSGRVYVAFKAALYIHNTQGPMNADLGGHDFARERRPGISVAFKTRRGDWLHSDFGFCFEDGKVPQAYGLGSCLTAHPTFNIYAGAFVGDTITLRGKEYVIERAPNNNIKLVAVGE